MKSVAYRGECLCLAQKCSKKAYYQGQLCGTHCPKQKRKYLPKNPNEKQLAQQLIQDKLMKAVPVQNPAVTATKMRMMKKPVPRDGFLLVCPNNKHAHNYGYPGDYSTLSPMRLGPVIINGVFCAHTIENFHQFAKVFPEETVKGDPCDCGRPFAHDKPSSLFFETRDKGYKDPVPHRHKEAAKGKNIPVYSVQGDCHYTYIESRYFYCNQMEILASREPALQQLREKYASGYCIDIHGYDAYAPDGTDADALYKHYCDDTRPFGHEMVILALLVLSSNEENYPWRIYKREHEDIYQCLQNKKICLI